MSFDDIDRGYNGRQIFGSIILKIFLLKVFRPDTENEFGFTR